MNISIKDALIQSFKYDFRKKASKSHVGHYQPLGCPPVESNPSDNKNSYSEWNFESICKLNENSKKNADIVIAYN